jgi:hypothetical protein
MPSLERTIKYMQREILGVKRNSYTSSSVFTEKKWYFFISVEFVTNNWRLNQKEKYSQNSKFSFIETSVMSMSVMEYYCVWHWLDYSNLNFLSYSHGQNLTDKIHDDLKCKTMGNRMVEAVSWVSASASCGSPKPLIIGIFNDRISNNLKFHKFLYCEAFGLKILYVDVIKQHYIYKLLLVQELKKMLFYRFIEKSCFDVLISLLVC